MLACAGFSNCGVIICFPLLGRAPSRRTIAAVDVAHGGGPVGSVDTGAGLDNIDYLPAQRLLYAAAAEAAVLTVIRVDEAGRFTPVRTVPTAKGARGVVVDSKGDAYVMDPIGGRILKVSLR